MDFGTGMIILGEFALLGAVIYCFTREKALAAWENRTIGKIKTLLRRISAAREYRRRQKRNQKALYTPIKPPRAGTEQKAA